MESKTKKEEKIRQLKEELAGLIKDEDRMKRDNKRKGLLLKRLNLKAKKLDGNQDMKEELLALERCYGEIIWNGVGTEFFNLFRLTV